MKPAKMTRILVADDHAVVRAGVRHFLEAESTWKICAEATTGCEAVDMAGKFRPDVVVLDIGMPELNGVDAARRIKGARNETQILIFSSHVSEQLVRDVFEAGACGYLFKSDAAQELPLAIKSILAHKPYYSPAISEIIMADYLKGMVSGATGRAGSGRLGAREREVVRLLCGGSTNKEVGARLAISVRTVETHRKSIMAKLELQSFSQLVGYAIRNHIVEA
jgi:DNA-binding NarL/FixJ family response regulator